MLSIGILTTILGAIGWEHLAALVPGGLDVRWVLVALASGLPLIGMPLTLTVTRGKSSQGFYTAFYSVAWDASYLANGETFDTSGQLPNRAVMAQPAGSAVDDELYRGVFVAGASDAPATAVLQMFRTGAVNAADEEVPNAVDLSAIDAQRWVVWGD